MATKKINELSEVINSDDDDLLLMQTSEGTRKITKKNLLKDTANKLDYDEERNMLQLKSNDNILSEIEMVSGSGGGGGISIGDISGGNITSNKTSIYLTWSDPENTVLNDITLAEWGGTRVVRKAGAAPTNKNDGEIVIDSKVKNAYSSVPFEDKGLEYGVTYYYRFFPYTKSKGYTDGTTLSIIPEKTKIYSVPTQNLNNIPVYDGTEKEAVFNNFDANELTVTGNIGVDAGTDYVASFVPKEDYCWSDGSVTAKTVTWSIEKADSSFKLSSNSVVLNKTTTTASINISDIIGEGEISIENSNNSIVTAVLSSDKTSISLSSPSQTSGLSTITVKLSEGSNYKATNKTISVTGDFLKLVSWSAGTDEEIVAMVEAAKNGQIDLADYWAVGQERQITLNSMTADVAKASEAHASQTVTFVLLHKGLYDLVTPAKDKNGNTRTKVSFIVGMKNNLAETGCMNSDGNNAGSWNSCPRRTWCNSTFYNAIPSSIRPIFAKFKTVTASENNSDTLKTSEDYFALCAEKEVFGTRTYSRQAEANALTQFEYYGLNSTNRVHKTGGNASTQTSGNWWWERSPYSGNSYYFCNVDNSGGAYGNIAYRTGGGLSPFGCIN